MEVLPGFRPAKENLFHVQFKPLTLSARFLGLNDSLKRVTDLAIVAITAILYCGGTLFAIVRIHDMLSEHVSTLEQIVETIQLLCGLFFMIIGFCNTFHVNSSLTTILSDLNEMDRQLSSTSFVSSYKFRKIMVLIRFSIHVLAILSILLIHIMVKHDVIKFNAIYYTIRFWPIFCIGIVVLLIVHIIDEVTLRLSACNEIVRKSLRNSSSVPQRQIYLCSVVYQSAFEVCYKLNTTFGISNLFLVGYCFISITAKIFFIFITLNSLQLATLADARECNKSIITRAS